VPRLATLFAIFLLALPGAAFAQGAGDDQYQDPFGDEQSQDGGGGSSDDGGLSDSPPSTGGGGGGSGSSGSGSPGSGSGSGSSGGGSSGTAPTTPAPSAGPAEAGSQLPRTGSDPLILMALGAGLVLTGVGLRLRTIDPDAF
jgi:hypothetical protein